MIRTLSILASLLFLASVHSDAQRQHIQSRPVDFIIKQIHYESIFNDTILVRLLFDFEIDDEGIMINGRGGLSLCGCYCDSIWDAWPSNIDMDIPGTGTMHFVSNGQGDPPPPGIPHNGVLGIRSLEGGLNRDSDFNLSTRFFVFD